MTVIEAPLSDEVAKDPKQVTQALRRLADGATWEEAIS